MNWKMQLLRYWLAMNASAFNSAVHALAAFFGVAGAHAVMDAIPALSIQQVAAVFLIAFGRAILAYLDANPLYVPLGIISDRPSTPPETGKQNL